MKFRIEFVRRGFTFRKYIEVHCRTCRHTLGVVPGWDTRDGLELARLHARKHGYQPEDVVIS